MIARTTVPILMMLAGVTLVPREVSADFIYDVVNYPALQNGYTVSGTITTSVNQGTSLPATDITSWSITIAGPSAPPTFTPSDSTVAGTFDVSPSALTVSTTNDIITFAQTNPPPPVAEYILAWTGDVANSTRPNTYALTAIAVPFPPSFWSSPFNPTQQSVAVVPEPSAGVLAVLGAVTGLAFGWVRKRRSQRRHDEGGAPEPTE